MNGKVRWNLILVVEEGKDDYEKVGRKEGLSD